MQNFLSREAYTGFWKKSRIFPTLDFSWKKILLYPLINYLVIPLTKLYKIPSLSHKWGAKAQLMCGETRNKNQKKRKESGKNKKREKKKKTINLLPQNEFEFSSQTGISVATFGLADFNPKGSTTIFCICTTRPGRKVLRCELILL